MFCALSLRQLRLNVDFSLFYIPLAMSTAEILTGTGVKIELETVEVDVLVLIWIETGDINGEERELVQTHAGKKDNYATNDELYKEIFGVIVHILPYILQ